MANLPIFADSFGKFSTPFANYFNHVAGIDPDITVTVAEHLHIDYGAIIGWQHNTRVIIFPDDITFVEFLLRHG